MGDMYERRLTTASLDQHLAGGRSSRGAFRSAFAKESSPMFLSMADSDIEQGSTTPESPPDDDSMLAPPRRDSRSHGRGSTAGSSSSVRSRGGGAPALARRDKRLPLPTPDPSTPEDDGSGGGLGDRAPFDSTSSGWVAGSATRHSSSTQRAASSSPAATTTTTGPTLGRHHHVPVRSDGSSRGHHRNRSREKSSVVGTGPDDKPDLRTTGVAGGGGRSRGRSRRNAEGGEAEVTTGDGRRSARGGSRSASRDRTGGSSGRNVGRENGGLGRNGGGDTNLGGSGGGSRFVGSDENHGGNDRHLGSDRKIGSIRNPGNSSSNRSLGGSRGRPDREAGDREAGVHEIPFSDFSGMVIDRESSVHARGGSVGGGGGGKHRRGSGSIGGGGGEGSGRSLSGSGAIAANGGLEPALKSHGCFSAATAIKLVTLMFALYNVSILWTRNYHPEDGRLCAFIDKSSCVTSVVPQVLLTMARCSAGAIFPSIAFCVLSKCYASRYFLHHSWLALIVDFEPTHKLHTYFGVLAVLCSVAHSACHIARSVYEDNADWLVKGPIHRSGLVALLLLLVSALPMSSAFLRDKLTYEFRKLLHLLFIPFMVAICFHGKPLRILGAVLLAWYLLDRLYFTTRMTFLVSAPIYKSVGRGTLVRFELPDGYQYKPGAYVQVNCPAIDAGEWHPFSLFPVPGGARQRAGFHVEAVGDWTDEFFRLCLENPRMPLWITAAQPSVVEQTAYYDNVVLVCTGAGITPAVSVAERFAKKKNVHLLWLSRDAGMIAMFEKQLRRVKSTVYLTGNPSERTKRRMVDLLAPSKGDVVATTTAVASLGSNSRTSSYRSVLDALEDGGSGGSGLTAAPSQTSIEGYRGVLKDDDDGGNESSGRTERATEYGGDDDLEGSSVLGGSAWGGASSIRGGGGGSLLGGGDGGSLLGVADSALGDPTGAAAKRRHHHRRRRTQVQRARGYHPVAVNFGRPDIEKIISEIIRGTAIQAEWAPVMGADASRPEVAKKPAPIAEEPRSRPVSGLRQVLRRLNTMQQTSKRHLMEADLSVVDTMPTKPVKASKSSFGAAVSGFGDLSPVHGRGGGRQTATPQVDPSSWLVLYCGANASVEQAVANACDGLSVKWCKEYFSKW
eukprot:g11168.t1